MLATETRQVPQIILKDGNTGSVDDLKSLEEGAVIKLTIKPRSDEAEVNFIGNFGGLYTGEGCPVSHKDCCFVFHVLDFDCPASLIPWLQKTYFDFPPTGYQFRHLEGFHSIRVLSQATIGADVIQTLYQERKNLKNLLTQIKEVAQTLNDLSA